MLDKLILQAVEAAFQFGFPLDAGAVLIMEVDGLDGGLAGRGRPDRGDRQEEQGPRGAQGEHRGRAAWLLWKGRKQAFGAIGRLGTRATARRTASCRGPSCRTSCGIIQAIGEKYDIGIANVFHAGDGNIHPILLFDERDADQVQAGAGRQPRDPRRVHPPAAAA